MKRLTAWIMILSVLVGITGCGSSGKEDNGWIKDNEPQKAASGETPETDVQSTEKPEETTKAVPQSTEASAETEKIVPLVFPGESDPIVLLCTVYAGMTVTAGQDVGNCPDYLWKTVVNGASMVILQTADADSEGNLYIEPELMDSYVHTMFPKVEKLPEITEWDGITPPGSKDDCYIVQADFRYDESTLEVLDMEYRGTDVIEILVYVKGQIDETVRVCITPVSEEVSTFGWIITGAEISQG